MIGFHYSRWAGILLFILILSATLSTTNPAIADSLFLTDDQPPPIVQGNNYRWVIHVQGGTAPLRFTAIDNLPLGLSLDTANGIVYGTPLKCTDQVSYDIKIQVNDYWNYGFWRIYTFKAKYKSTIKAGGVTFDGEINAYIDGNKIGHLRSGQEITQSFCYGDSHQISVDPETIFSSDNSTRYKATRNIITVCGDSPDAEFIFYREFFITVTSDPLEVSKLPPYTYSWSASNKWYREGDVVITSALSNVENGNTMYSFDHWLVPTSEEFDSNKLSWQATKTGTVIAYHKTFFRLYTDTPFIDIEGLGWKEKNTTANWRITSYAPKLTNDIGAFFGVYASPMPEKGTEFMDQPKMLSFNWQPEWRPAFGALIIGLIPYIVSLL